MYNFFDFLEIIKFEILRDWLQLKELTKFDTSCCNKDDKNSLLNLYEHSGFVVHNIFLNMDWDNVHFKINSGSKWLIMKKIKMKVCHYMSVEECFQSNDLQSIGCTKVTSVLKLNIHHIGNLTFPVVALFPNLIHLSIVNIRGIDCERFIKFISSHGHLTHLTLLGNHYDINSNRRLKMLKPFDNESDISFIALYSKSLVTISCLEIFGHYNIFNCFLSHTIVDMINLTSIAFLEDYNPFCVINKDAMSLIIDKIAQKLKKSRGHETVHCQFCYENKVIITNT
jgi:hypothetical protein